jgi:hypothetical protein
MEWSNLLPIVGITMSGWVRLNCHSAGPANTNKLIFNPYEGGKEEPGKYHSTKGGFVSNLDLFDPLEFGISAKEAQHLDPSLRLTLEVAHQVRSASIILQFFDLIIGFTSGAARFWHRLSWLENWGLLCSASHFY